MANGTSNSSQALNSAQQKTLSQSGADAKGGCPPPKHWIEVKLVDENGDPIPNEQYVITGPANEEHSGTLDGNGFVHIDGLDPGLCSVSFPNLYKRYRPTLAKGNTSP